MSRRELAALGITITIAQVQTDKVNDNTTQTNNNIATVTMATQVNPFYNVIDFSTD